MKTNFWINYFLRHQLNARKIAEARFEKMQKDFLFFA